MSAYYNEIEPFAAAWLRNLIAAGHIAPGDVDERSIEDVRPDDLRGYTQCHFFAGIGVWSHTLRLAGWPDDRRVWTGSCPCQPFSAAGKGAGFDDERHLWPAFHHLIAQCRPAVVLGEQVASSDAAPWLDLVHTDLEALGYAFGAVPFPSSGVGAPHIRDRLYWVADSTHQRHQWAGAARGRRHGLADGRDAHRVADTHDARPQGRSGVPERADQCTAGSDSLAGGMADAIGGRNESSVTRPNQRGLSARNGGDQGRATTGPTNGLWRDADWLLCRDGKWRPVEPGTFPLAYGASSRVGRLRAYGNAINAQAAQVFIGSVM